MASLACPKLEISVDALERLVDALKALFCITSLRLQYFKENAFIINWIDLII
jgi:hypothetical protein